MADIDKIIETLQTALDNAEIDGVTSIVKGVLEKLNDEKQEKTSNLYHLYCDKCGWDWWSEEAFPDKCPNCKCDRT